MKTAQRSLLLPLAFALAACGECGVPAPGDDPKGDGGLPAGEESDAGDGGASPLDAGPDGSDAGPQQSDAGTDGGPLEEADGGPDGPVADLPSYDSFVLYARTNFASNEAGAFNLPADHFFSGEDIQLNDHGEVSFRLTAIVDSEHKSIWFGAADESGLAEGELVYQSPDGAFMGQPSMNNEGLLVFDLVDVPTPALYFHDAISAESGIMTSEPFGANSRTGVTVNNSGEVGYRAGFASGNAHAVYDGSSVTLYAKETSLDPESPYSFLFNPAFNDVGQMASQVRYGPGTGNAQPDEIVLWDADGTAHVLAQDNDADATSPFERFFASQISMNNAGQVVFLARLVGGEEGVFLADLEGVETITSTEHEAIVEIEHFSPAVNDSGLVVFRAISPDGRMIYVGDGKALNKVVTEHDLLPTDLGDGRVDQHDDSAPVFGGGPAINAQGDVAFNCGLTPPDNDQVEWGTGVFVARASEAE